MKELYLDCNAHLPLHPKAIQAYSDFYQSAAGHGHPSSPSLPGRLAAAAFEDARGRIAKALGAQKPSQIIFTSNCTQACQWGLEILANIEINKQPPDGSHTNYPWKFYSSQLEHPAVREAFECICADYDCDFKFLPTDQNGVIQLVDTTDAKVVCIHLQNEIGTIQPLQNINCKYLFSDMSQSLGKIPIDLSKMNVDIAVFGSHKFGGPGGFGFIYVRDISWWKPHNTGSRYFMDRPGTPDVAGAVATAIALEEALSTLEFRTSKMKTFQSILEQGLEQRGYEIIGKGAPRSPNTTFVKLPNAFSILLSLSEHGIYAGLGSACGSLHAGPSLLARTLKLTGDAHDFMRISQWGEYGEQEANHFLNILDKVK